MAPDDTHKSSAGGEDDLDQRLDAALPGPLTADQGQAWRPGSFEGAPVAGQIIDDFELVALLGQGGMGQVWEARQLSLGGRRVALKLIRPGGITERYLEYFSREARAGARLSHSGLVAIHAHSAVSTPPWIAMELVEGGRTLRDLLDEPHRIAELSTARDRNVAAMLAAIADAMHSAHDRGVIHRDLKPENILITPDGKPKVTDFGLARITDETALSRPGDTAGTYRYMSPEQVGTKRTRVDHRSDIFSLGVVMYEWLTLRRPFQGETDHEVAHQILWQDPPDMRLLRPNLPRDLVVICGKALEKDPSRRYPSMAALAADIRRYISDEPIHAQPPTRIDRLFKWTKRNPTKSVAAVVTALAFVAVSGLGLRLKAKTAEAEESARVARENELRADKNAEESERKAADVLRLSLAQDYQDLVLEAGELWPAYPEYIPAYVAWISRAKALVGNVPELEAKRNELRALALPLTPDQERADRVRHPDFPDLERQKGELEHRERALAQRRDGEPAELPDVDWDAAPLDARRLAARARALVASGRNTYGKEPLGLALAARAMELASDEELGAIAEVLSQAYLAVGRDDDALEMAFMAMEESLGEEKAARELALAGLEKQVGELRSEAGLTKAEKEVLELEARVAELEQRVDERRTWVFSDEVEETTRARWWHNQLTGLIEDLGSLEGGLLAATGIGLETGWSVPRRLAFARRLEGRFAEGGEFTQIWADSLPGIHAAYPDLNLKPQMGLVPIGVDPDSGLWEFWHVQSGAEPRRGTDGSLTIEEESGLVFVLIPGGKFWMGAQSEKRDARNYDPHAGPSESPVHEVWVSAYLLSKFEMTQGQWQRVTGSNPSRLGPSTDLVGRRNDLTHPVEQVSWVDCIAILPKLGLTLPTEAQWEYGARAGTDTVWWSGAERESLLTKRAANLADQVLKRAGTTAPQVDDWPELDDGYAVHAPVDSYSGNPFGLFNVHGNVWELCLDAYDSLFYSRSAPSDPICNPFGTQARVLRGGSYWHAASSARSAFRNESTPTNADDTVGVRPAAILIK